MKKKLFFVNGALGSGKTTIINQLILSGKLGSFYIIENEFASLSIDNQCLHIDPKQTKILSGECVCCKDPKEFVNILKGLDNSEFQNIVVESSGVTSLNQLLANILADDSLSGCFEIAACIFLVDSLGISRTNVNDLEISDFVVVTKMDLLKTASQRADLDKFICGDFKNVEFIKKLSLDDNTWIESLLLQPVRSFQDWRLKINDKKHHGESFVKVLLGKDLVNFVPEIIFSKMKDFQINRVKGFFAKNGLIMHVEMTPEHMEVTATLDKKTPGVVAIGENKYLLDKLFTE